MREIIRYRVAPNDRIGYVRALVPALVPPEYQPLRLVGQTPSTAAPSHVKSLMVAGVAEARATGRPQRFEWASPMTGQPRLAICLHQSDGGVLVRIFAQRTEVEGLAPERRHCELTGTDGEN